MAKSRPASKPKTTSVDATPASVSAASVPADAATTDLGASGAASGVDDLAATAPSGLGELPSGSEPDFCPMCRQRRPQNGDDTLYTCLTCASDGYTCCVPNAVAPCRQCRGAGAA